MMLLFEVEDSIRDMASTLSAPGDQGPCMQMQGNMSRMHQMEVGERHLSENFYTLQIPRIAEPGDGCPCHQKSIVPASQQGREAI